MSASLLPFVAPLRPRRRYIASLVRVDREQMWVELNAQPRAGAILNVGFPAIVTESKEVAGGGLLITAERVGASDGR